MMCLEHLLLMIHTTFDIFGWWWLLFWVGHQNKISKCLFFILISGIDGWKVHISSQLLSLWVHPIQVEMEIEDLRHRVSSQSSLSILFSFFPCHFKILGGRYSWQIGYFSVANWKNVNSQSRKHHWKFHDMKTKQITLHCSQDTQISYTLSVPLISLSIFSLFDMHFNMYIKHSSIIF